LNRLGQIIKMILKLKLPEYFEVWVLPHKAGTTHKFILTAHHIRTVVLAAIMTGLLLLFGSGSIWFYNNTRPSKSELDKLTEENADLKKNLAKIGQKVALLEHTLSSVENLEIQLRRLTQINDPSRQLSIGPVSEEEFAAAIGGKNGTGRFNEALLLKLEETFGIANPEDLLKKLDELLPAAETNELKLAELSAFIREQKFVLSHAPSIWPARGYVTSGFGVRINPFTHAQQFHEGLDISNSIGTPVFAPADGVVAYAGFRDDYGKTLIIDHGYGVQTVYSHLADYLISQGEQVKRGQRIGAIGNSGRSTGPHLHYEIRIHGIARNPLHYIIE